MGDKRKISLLKGNPARKERDVAIAQERIAGKTYQQIADKFGVCKGHVGYILKDDEIKAMVEQGTSRTISMIPLANKVYYDRLTDPNEKALQLKAAQDIKKMAGILPSNVQNNKITQIFNQTNNLITGETMDLAKRILPGFNAEDIDVVEAEVIEPDDETSDSETEAKPEVNPFS